MALLKEWRDVAYSQETDKKQMQAFWTDYFQKEKSVYETLTYGTYFDAKGIEAIAQSPARETLLSRLLGSLQSPIANLARVINQVAEQKAEA